MVSAAVTSPVREVAEQRGLRVIELIVDPLDPAGTFTLAGLRASAPVSRQPRQRRHRALAPHLGHDLAAEAGSADARSACVARHATSPTTLRPRRRGPMPERDAALPHPRTGRRRCSPRSTPAASVVCTPGLPPGAVLRLARRSSSPTWYTAVPTMHAAVLARVRRPRGRRRESPAAVRPLLVGRLAGARSRAASRTCSACR